MNQFPPLSNWFRFLEQNELYDQTKTISNWYYEHNECSFFTLLWIDWADKNYFIKEFVKLIARIRTWWDERNWSDLELLYLDLINYIENSSSSYSLEERVEFINNVFSTWMKSWKTWTIDLDMCRGYIGEILYYLIREQYLSDEKHQIHPAKPKDYSKEPWLDFTEIRKDVNWYYLIIWEVKSTSSTIGSYPKKIVEQLNKWHRKTLNQHVNHYKELSKKWLISDSELKEFINKIYNFSNINKIGFKSDKKRFTWVVNYSRDNKHLTTVFDNFKISTSDTLSDNINCRKVKLIWIKDFDTIVNWIYNYIFVDFLR